MNKNLKDFTYCKDSDCKIKEHCFRFNDQNPDEYFTESPRTDNKCDMFWGEQQENIFDMLLNITMGNENNKKNIL